MQYFCGTFPQIDPKQGLVGKVHVLADCNLMCIWPVGPSVGGIGRKERGGRGGRRSRAESVSYHHNTITPTSTSCHKENPVILPYIRRISEQLRKVFRYIDTPAYFKLTNTLWELLVHVHPKEKVEKGKVVCPVYHISCMWWMWCYECGGDWTITEHSFLVTPEKE